MKKIFFFPVLLLSFLLLLLISPSLSRDVVFAQGTSCVNTGRSCGTVGGPGVGGGSIQCCNSADSCEPAGGSLKTCQKKPGGSGSSPSKPLQEGDTCKTAGGAFLGTCPAGTQCGSNNKCTNLPPYCECNTPNKIGKDAQGHGYNGYHCFVVDKNGNKTSAPDTKNDAACEKADQACQNTPTELHDNKGKQYKGFVCSEPFFANCTCDNEGESGSGNNGFTCKDALGPGKDFKNFCNHEDFACNNDPGNINTITVEKVLKVKVQGINCVGDQPRATLPPPPSPPCRDYDAQGRCLSVTTAFGDLQTDPGQFIVRIFSILLSLSGGIALLLIMRAGYRIMTSRGNSEALQQGREQLIAAIVGLIFLIFSFVILQTIGVDILRIPGLSSTGAGAPARPGPRCNPASCVPSANLRNTCSHPLSTGCPAGQGCCNE